MSAQETLAAALYEHWGDTFPADEAECCAAEGLAALAADGFAIMKVDDYNRDLAAVAEWQRTALIVITAANNFITDCVTGDGDPRTIAKALIDSGFDGRTER